MVVRVDMAMGLSLEEMASRTASSALAPCSFICVIARSTIRIGLFTTVPIRMRKPSMEIMSKGC